MRQYYIHDGEVKKGPFDFEQLKQLPLNNETPIWYEGLPDWTRAANLNELQQLLITEKIPPPLPKAFENSATQRYKLLDSFTDAREVLPESNKNNLLLPILITIVIIAGIIITILHYR